MFARIGNIVGYLLIILGASELLPALMAVYFQEQTLILPFLVSALATMFIGAALYLAFQDLNEQASKHEIILFLFCTWLGLPLFASIPFMTSGVLTKLSDSYFEAASALTTNGSTILTNIDLVPRTVIFWRSLLQWEGGLLILCIAVAILPLTRIGGIEMFRSALPHGEGEGLMARIRYAFIPLIKIYTFLTALCMILLLLSGFGAFNSLTVAMATLSSGGFLPHETGLQNMFNGTIELILLPFMILAATNFTYHWSFFSGSNLKIYKSDIEISGFFYILAVGAALILIGLVFANSHFEAGFLRKIWLALFSAVSILSTTGFLPDRAAEMPVSVIVIASILLFIGGTTGSTAGGFKILRFKILLRHADREVSRLAHPHSIVPLRINDLNVSASTLYAVWILLFIFTSAAAFSAIFYGAMQLDLQTSLGLTLVNLFSAGGLTELFAPDFVGYHSLPLAGKWLTSMIMIVGRLEVIAFMICFMPSFWRN
ncbi:TrkH family potassium uptake protein [Emcibacter sp.]|uniref:TrkH family potassium uptake protein n=1 Tax=Emcibacter sp. TaxID=1979954 RepID=UPI002AA7123B|nr:potassium transporter TrkG [Emcibacter sp.]